MWIMQKQRNHNVSGRAVYFSELLAVSIPGFLNEISKILETQGVEVRLLPHTKDIWCRDYLPIRVAKGKFVQFKYDPEYLKAKRWRRTKTNPAKTCRAIGLNPFISDIVLDGGNVVRCGKKAIMTERVFKDNPNYPCKALEFALKDLLRVEDLIIIPFAPDDPFFHADGCVRFVNEDTVVVNEPMPGQKYFCRKLRAVLKRSGLECVEMSYSIDNDPVNEDSAVGNYVNFLAVGNTVLVPAYKGHEAHNQEAAKMLSRWFKKVVSVEATALAKQGGVLNCASWEK